MRSDIKVFENIEPFIAYEGNMSFCHNKLTKVPGVMILYCTSGIGQLQINFKEYTLIENTLVTIIVTSTIMRLQASNDFKVTFILFPHDIMVELGTQIDHQLIVFIKHNPVYTHTSESSVMTKRMIDSMIDIYKDKRNRFREQMMKNQLQNFFLDFYDKAAPYLHKDEYLISSRQEELFRRFISQLQSDITREREVRYYAEKLFITPRYLSLISHQITGKTAKEVIDGHVIVELKTLLQSTNLTVREITERMNFPDPSFMGKFFKKHTGLSPGEFRKL